MSEQLPGESEASVLPADSDGSADAVLEQAAAEQDAGVAFDDPELPELEDGEKVALMQALLFASSEPMSASRLAEVSRFAPAEVKDLLESLQMNLEMEDSGIELKEIGGKYQLRTKPTFSPFLRLLRGGKAKKLSEAALETLAIIAYRQPIVKSDIEKIRGVDATPTLKTLVDRRLVRVVGHKETAGLPALFGTTDNFLKVFGLSSLSELPSLRDLRELESDPGEVGESDAADFASDDDGFTDGEGEFSDETEDGDQNVTLTQ